MSYAVAKWRDKGINLRVAVNISARQLADQTIFTALKQVLRELNFEYCPIDVELTESCLIENDELALSVIQQFSRLGASSSGRFWYRLLFTFATGALSDRCHQT